MAQWIKENTAVTITFGPALLISDGVTPVTTLASGTVDEVGTYEHEATAITSLAAVTMTHRAGGMYTMQLTAASVNTVGLLTFYCRDDSACLPIWKEFMVVPANVWDSMFGTDNLDVNVAQWLGTAAATPSVAGRPSVDSIAVSGDTTAADNLELQYDGTGITGDSFPSTQAQLSAITNVGSAVNTSAGSYTLTTGTQSSGTFSSTAALDGTNHEHTDTAGAMDLYYEFDIGSGTPSSVTFTGYLNGNNDDLEVYGYNWVGAAWVQIGTLAGKAASTNEVDNYALFTSMVGTGANFGTVRIRFTDGAFTLTTATLAVDQVFVSFSQGASVYEDGAVWIDTTVTNTGTVSGVDGVSTNPVSTIAAANTLAANLNLNRFRIAPGSSFTLAADQTNQVFSGDSWTIALGGQTIDGSTIVGATVSGIATNTSGIQHFVNCTLGAVTLPGDTHLIGCGLSDTQTAGEAGDFFYDNCHSAVAGSGSITFDFGAALNSSNLNVRHHSGGWTVANMGAGTGTYNASFEGDGQIIWAASCSATSNASVRGNWKITDNASGAVTETLDDNQTSIDAILVDTAMSIPAIIGTPVGADISADIALVQVDTTAIVSDTNELQGDWKNTGRLDTILDTVNTNVSALNDISAADVNAQVVDVIRTDTDTELAAIPAATIDLHTMVQYLYMAARNKRTTTATADTVSNDAGTTIATSTISDDTTTFTRGEYV